MKKTVRMMLIASALLALGGCVAVPASPVYYDPPPAVYVPAPVFYGSPVYYGPSIHFGYYRGWGGRGHHGGHGHGRR